MPVGMLAPPHLRHGSLIVAYLLRTLSPVRGSIELNITPPYCSTLGYLTVSLRDWLHLLLGVKYRFLVVIYSTGTAQQAAPFSPVQDHGAFGFIDPQEGMAEDDVAEKLRHLCLNDNGGDFEDLKQYAPKIGVNVAAIEVLADACRRCG